MVAPDATHTPVDERAKQPFVSEPAGEPEAGCTERPLPFVLRRGVVWTGFDEMSAVDDGMMAYWQRAPLTGAVAATSRGRDVGFSDLEVS